jgi:hypothetical protein
MIEQVREALAKKKISLDGDRSFKEIQAMDRVEEETAADVEELRLIFRALLNQASTIAEGKGSQAKGNPDLISGKETQKMCDFQRGVQLALANLELAGLRLQKAGDIPIQDKEDKSKVIAEARRIVKICLEVKIDPFNRNFLSKAIVYLGADKFLKLLNDPRFMRFHEHPVIFAEAVINHAHDPEAFLLAELQAFPVVAAQLKADPEFVGLRDMDYVFDLAPLRFRPIFTNPRSYLSNVMIARKIFNDALKGIPAYRNNGFHGPKALPETAAETNAQLAEQLRKNPQFADLKDMDYVFDLAAIKCRPVFTTPKSYLENVRIARKIFNDALKGVPAHSGGQE